VVAGMSYFPPNLQKDTKKRSWKNQEERKRSSHFQKFSKLTCFDFVYIKPTRRHARFNMATGGKHHIIDSYVTMPWAETHSHPEALPHDSVMFYPSVCSLTNDCARHFVLFWVALPLLEVQTVLVCLFVC